MKWRKKGRIYVPQGVLWWAKSYALIPTADVIDDQVIRVYFASLGKNHYGRIGYVDLDADNPKRILYESKEPVLDIGELGTFDDSGVNPSCIVNVAGKKYLYYIGWQRCERVPYMLFAGLAISNNGLDFTRVSRTPILERTNTEPFIRSATTVIYDKNIYIVWYVSASHWITVNEVQYPQYVIRYADSDDGIHWNNYDHICINFKDENEFGFGRPWVIYEQNIYKMWYSIRSRIEPYKMGYAESNDGVNWVRKDSEVGIKRSESGWDSEMICYPCVVDTKGKRYMFYNGNRHGLTGFGYAVLED